MSGRAAHLARLSGADPTVLRMRRVLCKGHIAVLPGEQCVGNGAAVHLGLHAGFHVRDSELGSSSLSTGYPLIGQKAQPKLTLRLPLRGRPFQRCACPAPVRTQSRRLVLPACAPCVGQDLDPSSGFAGESNVYHYLRPYLHCYLLYPLHTTRSSPLQYVEREKLNAADHGARKSLHAPLRLPTFGERARKGSARHVQAYL